MLKNKKRSVIYREVNAMIQRFDFFFLTFLNDQILRVMIRQDVADKMFVLALHDVKYFISSPPTSLSKFYFKSRLINELFKIHSCREALAGQHTNRQLPSIIASNPKRKKAYGVDHNNKRTP